MGEADQHDTMYYLNEQYDAGYRMGEENAKGELVNRLTLLKEEIRRLLDGRVKVIAVFGESVEEALLRRISEALEEMGA
jgi:hypothetical protein